MKCSNCGKRMKKIAKKYQHYDGVKLVETLKPVHQCMWCGEMHYGI